MRFTLVSAHRRSLLALTSTLFSFGSSSVLKINFFFNFFSRLFFCICNVKYLIELYPVNHCYFPMAIAVSARSCHFSLRGMESCTNGSRTWEPVRRMSCAKFDGVDLTKLTDQVIARLFYHFLSSCFYLSS
ncbi:hypothetical protein PUN28_019813 [Cardiocondyla obscurior]|uniref:Secreted protein n=1 Tax=Cardiocondyla obscurior TaxID=286306 RepID=A0AAW2EBL6_9HYME